MGKKRLINFSNRSIKGQHSDLWRLLIFNIFYPTRRQLPLKHTSLPISTIICNLIKSHSSLAAHCLGRVVYLSLASSAERRAVFQNLDEQSGLIK